MFKCQTFKQNTLLIAVTANAKTFFDVERDTKKKKNSGFSGRTRERGFVRVRIPLGFARCKAMC